MTRNWKKGGKSCLGQRRLTGLGGAWGWAGCVEGYSEMVISQAMLET